MSDLLIIGSGVAGLSAAIKAHELGLDTIVVSKSFPAKSQSVMAQGGINCPNDEDLEKFVEDTKKAACGIGDEHAIELMCSKAKGALKRLESFGVPFSRDGDGRVAKRKLGGTQGKYACYAQDYTGLKIVHTMFDRCNKNGQKFLNEHYLLSVEKEDNGTFISTFLDIKTGSIKSLPSKTVIFATGGYSKIYGKCSTNASGTTGDGIVAAKNAGCKISGMEYIQFHPTSLAVNSVLISESARGEGGYLVDEKGQRFVDELLPRDQVARAINDKMNGGSRVYLDIRHLGAEFIEKSIPQEAKLAKIFQNCDAGTELIEIKPSAHYSIGGIEVDTDGKTTVEGIFACGECAHSRVHGGNRLGGNSLLEAFVFGEVAAQTSFGYINSSDTPENQKEVEEPKLFKKGENFYPYREELHNILRGLVFLERDEKELIQAKGAIAEIENKKKSFGIEDESPVYNTNLTDLLEFLNEIEIGKMVVESALENRDSIGVHYRRDL